MRLPTFARRAPFVALALLGLASAGCGSSNTIPSPVLTTEVFTGTVAPLGADFKNFVVNYQYSASDASVTLTNLVTSANSTPLPNGTIGIAFGQPAFDGSCAISATYSANSAKINQVLTTSGGVFIGPTTYCVKIYDGGTLTEPVIYTVSVQHY